jgi:hypothetical protein
MKKSLIFFTHAVQGTLGDVSGTVKLVQSIKNQSAEPLDIMIVLIADAENKSKASVLLKDLDVSTLVIGNSELKNLLASRKSKNLTDEPNLHSRLMTADGIVISLTFRHFQQMAELAQYAKPVFIINEYDPHPDNLASMTKMLSLQFTCPPFAIMNTGLKKEHLGIFCTNETETSNNTKLLSKIGAADHAFRNLLLQGTDSDHYQDTHKLFLGYFNALDFDSSANNVNVSMFIESSLNLVPQQTRIVDFVLPIKQTKEYGLGGRYKHIQELLAYFKQNPKVIEGYRIEFWNKNSGEMQRLEVPEFEQKEEANTKVIRIINGFPFTPETMNILMKASDEFVMVTGDQSLSEAISNKKIFIYQTMWWKEVLWESLLATVKDTQGEQSKFYQFLKMQGSYSDTDLPVFKQFLLENKTEICQGSESLIQYLLQNKDLKVNFAVQLFSYLNSPPKIIKETIKNWPIHYRSNRLELLIKMYPSEAKMILNTALEEQMYNKKTFMEDLVMASIYNKDHESLINEVVKLMELYPEDSELIFEALINQRKIKLEKLKNLDQNDYIVFAAINAFCKEALREGVMPEAVKKVVDEINRIKENQRLESEHFLREHKPEIKNIDLLKNNGIICKIISHAAAIHRENIYPWESKEEVSANSTFVDFLKKINKDTPLSVNLIKALDIVSRFKPNLANLNFNEATVTDLAELFKEELRGELSAEEVPDRLQEVLSLHQHPSKGVKETEDKEDKEPSEVNIKMPQSPSKTSFQGTLLQPRRRPSSDNGNENSPEEEGPKI